jgi:putative ABC transport system permease protein
LSYALQTLWHEKTRYAAGVGAVAFSAMLMVLQVGLLLGLFETTSIPVDHTNAHIWIGSQDVKSIDLGTGIRTNIHMARLTEKQGLVGQPELFLANYANVTRPDGGMERCYVLGSSMAPNAAGAADVLTPELRNALSMPNSIVIDESDLKRMNLKAVGDTVKISGVEVTLVGTVKGIKSLAAPWVFCSLTTARTLLNLFVPPEYTTYLLAQAESPEAAKRIVEELRSEYEKEQDMAAFTAEEFSFSCRWYWLTRTKAGIAIGYAALLGLLVGAVITAQTLYSATMASAKEFATLLALGIPRRKIYGMVMQQSFWVGIFGILVAYPVVRLLAYGASLGGAKVVLRWEILSGAAVVTLGTALFSGLIALRSVRKIEPMSLLR